MKSKWLFLGTLLFIFATFLPFSTAQTSVTTCQALDTANTRYELDASINATDNCFTVTANNITFDGNGRYVISNDSGTGFNVDNVNDFTLLNLNLTSFDSNIDIRGVNGFNITNVILSFSFLGDNIFLRNVTNVDITNVTSLGGNDGLDFATTQGGSHNILIQNSLFVSSGISGIRIGSDSGEFNIKNNNFTGNSQTEILIQGGGNITIDNNNFTGGVDAIQTTASVSNLTITNNDFNDFSSDMFSFSATNLTEIINNSYSNIGSNLFNLNAVSNIVTDVWAGGFSLINVGFFQLQNENGTVNYEFISSASGDFDTDLIINNNFVFGNQSTLNFSANITLKGLTPTIPIRDLLRNGVTCQVCSVFNDLDGTEVTFNTSSFSNFSLGFDFNTTQTEDKNPVFEGEFTTFQLDVNLSNIEDTTTEARLIWNNTYFIPISISRENSTHFSKTILVPDLTDTAINITWNWEFNITNVINSSTNDTLQEVRDIDIDDCTTHTTTLLNLTVVDEDSQTILATGSTEAVNISIDLTLGANSFNRSFTDTNPVAICISQSLANSNLTLNSIISYVSTDRVLEFHNIQNFSVSAKNIAQNITLRDLAVTRSQEFLITVRDQNFLPVDDAIIDITRQYIGDGVFKTVERPLTDFDGRTIGHFVLNDIVYTINIQKQGFLLATFDNIVTFCDDIVTGDCRLNLNIDEGIQGFDTDTGLNVTFLTSFNINTRTFKVVYSTTDGTAKNIKVNITKFDAFGNVSLCFNQQTASSGTINCVIPTNVGNVTGLARVLVGEDLLFQQIIYLPDMSVFPDQSRYLLAIILILVLPLMAFTGPEMMLVFYLIGMVIASSLALISFGGLIGPLSAFLWFVVATGVLIWKINRRESR